LGAINSGPAKLLLRGQGYAFNPQQQILFEGIDFRTYTMSFTFTPYSQEMITVNPSDHGFTAATADTDILSNSGATLNTFYTNLITVEITNLP
jgi:hypothetical protein